MRISRVLVIALWGYCVIGLWGCAKKEIRNLNSKGKNIICFGDSITFGYGAGQDEDYPTALAEKVSVPVINAGVDGDTTFAALKRLKPDVLDRDPLLVIIEFSGNDFLRKVPLEATVRNIKEMVRQVQRHGAMAVIADISAGPFMREYRGALGNLARQEQAIFVAGILSGIITNPSLKSDFFHPNKDGYQLIAGRIYQVISPYLEKNILQRKP
jgi:lysophospholipase L1-like esterase